MPNKKVELLAPAGTFEALKAACAAGADAIYIGGKNYSARAFAGNFDNETIIEAINYCHLRGIKLYVAINTLLNDYELDHALKEVEFLYQNKVDALIIQDLGLYYELIKNYPDFEIHASTQMNINNIEAVKSAKKMGFKRVVIARETSLVEINEMTKLDIEIEMFVHGALCSCYSGQCLISSVTSNRSANKGACSQCCRLPYRLFDVDENKYVDIEGSEYLLSTKDLNTLENIPEIIKTGVASLKIEGRMKSSSYVYWITFLYRKAIDYYYQNRLFNYDKKMALVLYNRGFCNTYLFDKGAKDLLGQDKPNHRGLKIGKVLNVHHKKAIIKLEEDLHQFDGIRFGNAEGLILNRLYKNGLLISEAKKGDIVEVDIDFYLKEFDVYKTSDYLLEQAIDFNNVVPKYALDVKLKSHIGDYLTIEFKYDEFNDEFKSDYLITEAKTNNVDIDKIKEAFDHFKETPFYLNNFLFEGDTNSFIPLSIIKKIRREVTEILNKELLKIERQMKEIDYEVKTVPYVKRNLCEFLNINQIKDMKTDEYLLMSEAPVEEHYLIYPNIKPHYLSRDKVVISELGGLFYEANHKISNHTLNCYNARAYQFLRDLGFEAIIASPELDKQKLERLLNRVGGDNIHIYGQGRRELMHFKYSPLATLPNLDKKHHYELVYKDQHFPLIKKENRYVILEDKQYLMEGKLRYIFKSID